VGAGNIFSYSFPTCRVTKERPLRVDEGYDSDNQVVAYPTRDARGPQLASGRIALGFILDFARRRSWVILFSVLVMCGVGLAYLMLVPALYTGVAILQIDPRTFQLFSQAVNLGDQSFGGAQVESHLEALKSENLELKVINDLHLSDDAEFGLAAAIPIISNLVETRSPDSETWRTRNALRIFDKRYTVQRRGIFLIEINFESANPERAAQIANAIAQAYVIEADQELVCHRSPPMLASSSWMWKCGASSKRTDASTSRAMSGGVRLPTRPAGPASSSPTIPSAMRRASASR